VPVVRSEIASLGRHVLSGARRTASLLRALRSRAGQLAPAGCSTTISSGSVRIATRATPPWSRALRYEPSIFSVRSTRIAAGFDTSISERITYSVQSSAALPSSQVMASRRWPVRSSSAS
jgi:hypothetical protein